MRLRTKLKSTGEAAREVVATASSHLFNYRRIWRVTVILTGVVSLVPLIFITVLNYEVMQRDIEAEFISRTTGIVANTTHAISFFLSERKSAMDFIVHDNNFETLSTKERLSGILENLQRSFGGGFMDLGIIDSVGLQRNYVGPYNLEGKNYKNQAWFKQVQDHGVHVSDVFLGYRKVPHLVIAVKGIMPGGSFYVLRAAIGIQPFESLLSNMELHGRGDAFMINRRGVFQTTSRYHGNVLETLPLPVPEFSQKTKVFEEKDRQGKDLLIGYRYIDETPFILMIVNNKNELMKPWVKTRLKLIAFLLISLTVILTVILGTATYMVKKIKIADEKRILTFHQVEYANKMASIGRMAASVAHEINNPLAIINEKAGLIKDLCSLRDENAGDKKLINLVDSILGSVKRSGIITKRLLNFARNLEARIEPVDIKKVVFEVVGFLGKEAEIRSIGMTVAMLDDIPLFECDRGKLQQIFINIIHNAYAAVDDGGYLNIKIQKEGDHFVSVAFTDDGCGIPEDDLNHIYEPFFSTKAVKGGTGLGLSITYGLVQEIGGKISAQSELGKGTSFTVFIPLVPVKKGENNHASITCG